MRKLGRETKSLTLILTAVALTWALATATVAEAAPNGPDDNSAVGQYVEFVPGADGGKPSKDKAGDAGKADPEEALGASGGELADLNTEAAAVLAATADAPAGSSAGSGGSGKQTDGDGNGNGGGSGAGAGGGGGELARLAAESGETDALPLSAGATSLFGEDDGGLGIGLPILMVVIAAGAVALVVRKRKSAS